MNGIFQPNAFWALVVVHIFIFGMVPAALAERKGRRLIVYFLVSLFFSLLGLLGLILAILTPLTQDTFVVYLFVGLFFSPLGFILAALMPKTQDQTEKDKLKSGEFKKCPACIQAIPTEATKCRYCGTDMPKEKHI